MIISEKKQNGLKPKESEKKLKKKRRGKGEKIDPTWLY